MSFFNNEDRIFLLLKQDRLQLFSKKNDPLQLTFPQEAVTHQEVIDKKLFEKIMRDFLTHVKQHEIIIFLDNELVFQKKIPASSKDEENKFFNEIPFSQENAVRKAIKITSSIWLFSANRELYQVIMLLLVQQGCRVSYVVPLLLFTSFTQNHPLSFSLFLHIIKNKTLLEKGNLLHEDNQPKQNVIQETVSKSPVIQYIALGISVLILAGVLVFALSFLGILPGFTKKQTSSPKIPITSSPILPTQPIVIMSPTPLITQSVTVDKKDLKIQILNGSSIAGQASSLKNQFESIGFANIQTDNAQGAKSNTTIAVFSNRVSSDDKNIILTVLNKIFTTIDTQQIATTGVYDIFITTGEGTK